MSSRVCFDCERVVCVCDNNRCSDCFEMYRECICVTFVVIEGCDSDDLFCECLFCIPGA